MKRRVAIATANYILKLTKAHSRAAGNILNFEGHRAGWWCNPLTLQPEQSGGVGSIPGRTT